MKDEGLLLASVQVLPETGVWSVGSHWLWLVGGVVLAAMVGVWIMRRK